MSQQKITFQFAFGIVLIIVVLIVGILFLPRQTIGERQAVRFAKQEQLVQALADQRANERKAEADRINRWNQSEANEVLRSIGYIKDMRTHPPTCFAYRLGSRSFDGPSLALATVSCEAIPPAILYTAK